LSSVDLPEPDGPITATYSPAAMRRSRPAQRVHLAVAELENRSMPASSISAAPID
jgi:hypothetical protein